MSDEQRASACASCGVGWANHLGIVGTCAENKRLRDRLRHAEELLEDVLGDATIFYEEKTLSKIATHLEAARQEDGRSDS